MSDRDEFPGPGPTVTQPCDRCGVDVTAAGFWDAGSHEIEPLQDEVWCDKAECQQEKTK